MICSQINSHAFFAREKIYTAELHIASQSKSKIWCAAYLTDFSLFLAILLRMAKNSPFSERLNDSGTLSHTLPKALPLESGREQAAEQPVPSVSFADISPHCGESPLAGCGTASHNRSGALKRVNFSQFP